MRISQGTWTAILVLASVSILGLEYDVIWFKDVSINLSIVTISDLKVNKPHVLEIVALAILAISIFMQSKYTLQELKSEYSRGYKNLSLVEFVTNYIANICGHNAYGSPFGNFKPSLFKKPIKPGRFTAQSGRLSEDLSIALPSNVHLKSVVSGVWAVATSKGMLFGVVPIFLGLWSITVIVI
ncbi:MAG: hypothetical protein V7721_11705 [Porticoccaceae bacterium]